MAIRDNLNNLLQLPRERSHFGSLESLTLDSQQGLVDLAGEQRLGQLPEELLEDGGHVMDAHLVSQDHINAAVKVFPELKKRAEMRKCITPTQTTHLIYSLLIGANSKDANCVQTMQLQIPEHEFR